MTIGIKEHPSMYVHISINWDKHSFEVEYIYGVRLPTVASRNEDLRHSTPKFLILSPSQDPELLMFQSARS